MIIVFTGDGKGKTTAALGSAVRALGQGKRALMIQFIKGPLVSGEHKFAEKFKIQKSKFKIIRGGKGFVGILGDPYPRRIHIEAAKKTLKLAAKALASKKWDLIILDEVNVAVDLGLIKAKDVLRIVCVSQRISPRESAPVIIMTGRNAPKSFIKKADLVTEMKEIKHPYKTNRKAQIAVEF
jgi:cob(I)alamin adenosyltransferase